VFGWFLVSFQNPSFLGYDFNCDFKCLTLRLSYNLVIFVFGLLNGTLKILWVFHGLSLWVIQEWYIASCWLGNQSWAQYPHSQRWIFYSLRKMILCFTYFIEMLMIRCVYIEPTICWLYVFGWFQLLLSMLRYDDDDV